VECVKERKIDMSANCDYVYVQGLRFRTRDVSVVLKDDIRAFTKLIDRVLPTTRVVGPTKDFQVKVYDLLRRNPATPADVLSGIDASPGRQDGAVRWQKVLERIKGKPASLKDLQYALSEATAAQSLLGWYHVLTTVRDHPNATPTQVNTATELLEKGLEEWSRREPPSPN
jgi:hypothetical protein